ncbi:c-type cytochrome [Parendozoicomonas sp. Alg238-R29]|uniref:c-type cytochrome n=1 Tax=Parendozoicomonas sp. Alg238-R29 TaxID=2993446 RepID=UPI00248EE6B3|nr:c-type cytochrome [Parendozoicomonas sp. Alg238-R29]
MIKKLTALATTTLLTSTMALATPDHERQLQLIQMKGCASCHGTKGQGNTTMKGPRLAGQTQEQLIEKINAYRSGEKKNPTMAMMTYSLTDQEIETLATYFSQFK